MYSQVQVRVQLADKIQAGATDIYVEFVGWGLNATAKDSYLLKGINTAWQSTNSGDKTTFVGFDWDASKYFRSYWGTFVCLWS